LKSYEFVSQLSATAAVAIVLLGAASGAAAQAPTQQQMAAAMKMQQCMANLDPSVMEKIEASGKKFEAEVKALCKAGKREEAQNAAMAYGREMATSEEMKAMAKCGDMAAQMMPSAAAHAGGGGAKGEKPGNICDEQ